MDSSTKQRYISTSIWSDEWFDTLSVREKLVYFHLLTNEFTNAAGVYHFSLKQVRIDLDISRDEVNAAMEKFEAAGKAYYYREYIIIPKWLKHQKISERSKMFLGALSILRGLPDEIRRFIADRKHYDFPVEKYVQIPSINRLCPVEDRLCLKNDRLSRNGGKNGIGYAKNTENPAHDSDSDSDLDLDLDSDIDLDDDDDDRLACTASRGEKSPGGNSGPGGAGSSSPDFIKKIKAESLAAGFAIPGSLARHMAETTGPPWLEGPHSYFRFAAGQIRDQYREKRKTEAELRNIYLAALRKGWESFLAAYPAWRKKREAAAAAEAAAREAERLKRDPPEVCPGCGGPVKDGVCSRCRGRFRFREEPPGWEFFPHLERSLAGDLGKIRRGELPETVPADPVF